MRLSLLILSAPYSGQTVTTALRYAEAAIAGGHEIYRVFFYHDGVLTGSSSPVLPRDEINLTERWTALAAGHDIDLVVCVSSALKRGVLDQTEASRYERDAPSLASGFEISGLGQLIDACIHSDRMVTFG